MTYSSTLITSITTGCISTMHDTSPYISDAIRYMEPKKWPVMKIDCERSITLYLKVPVTAKNNKLRFWCDIMKYFGNMFHTLARISLHSVLQAILKIQFCLYFSRISVLKRKMILSNMHLLILWSCELPRLT